MNQSNISEIEKHLNAGNWETARRACLRELAKGPSNTVSMLLHRAYHYLADIPALRSTLDDIVPSNEEELFERLLLEVQDADRLATNQYRFSFDCAEAKAGLSMWEYFDKWKKRSAD